MGYPSPTSPTLNDAEFQYFSNLVPVFYFQPAAYDQTVTSEKVTLNVPGFTGLIDTEDFVSVDTNSNTKVVILQPGPSSLTLQVSDLTVTSENVGTPDVPGWTYNAPPVSDTTITSENVTVTHT